MAGPTFGSLLRDGIDALGRLCVGIDPHPYLLRQWGLEDDAAGVREFGLRVIEACATHVAVVKPQVAFFERHGSAGYAALEDVLAAARAAGLLIIADVKRGDIGTSVEAYAQAWLAPGSPLEADAMTVSAFQGLGSLAGPLELAADTGKGLFVLVATSNPEARAVQTARTADGRTVSGLLRDEVDAWNVAHGDAGTTGSIGLVLGATLDLAEAGVDIAASAAVAAPVLAPGFGAQGAGLEDLGRRFGALAPTTLVSESRSLLAAGPAWVRAAIVDRAAEVRGIHV